MKLRGLSILTFWFFFEINTINFMLSLSFNPYLGRKGPDIVMKYILFFSAIVFSLSLGDLPADERGLQVPIIRNQAGKEVGLYEESHALIIGAGDYTGGWPDLPGVLDDIQSVKDMLEKKGFHVVVVNNPNHVELEKAFTDFINHYGQKPNSRLLFYFAGHGCTLKLAYGDEMGYIIPIDAPNPYRNKRAFLERAMDMQMIEVYAKRIQAKHALFVFDSCFSGSIFSLSRAAPESITYKTSYPVRQFITSGSANEQVPDKSVFCRQFIAALSGEGDTNNDGYVTGAELGEFLQNTIVNYSKGGQHPQYGKMRHPSLDKGDFVFFLPSGGSRSQQKNDKPGDPEADMWKLVKHSNDISDVKDFLEAFPQGRFEKVARLKYKQLKRKEIKERHVETGSVGEMLLEDDFSRTPSVAHALFGNDIMSFENADGKGCLTAFQGNAVLPAMYSSPIVDDFIAEFDFQPKVASPDGQYGLIFRSDDAAGGLAYYYLLNITPTERVIELWTWVATWVSRSVLEVKQGIISMTGENHVRMEAKKSTFRIFINDHLIGEFHDSNLTTPGILGLTIISKNPPETVCFDNFIVYANATSENVKK